MRCDWNLAQTQSGIVLKIFDEMQLEFGLGTIWNCPRIFSIRCDWILARKQFERASEFFG